MESETAVRALSALAHEGRLGVFRELVRSGPDGLPAGEIAHRLGILPNTLSASLNLLSNAGLVASRRQGRSIIYRAAYDRMGDLLAYLMQDCCQGRPEVCAPLNDIAAKAVCCEPKGAVQ